MALKGTRKYALYEQLSFIYGLKSYAPARDPCNSSRSSPGFTIFSWDSLKFSNFQFLHKWDSPNFVIRNVSGLVKVNCYKYP